MGQIIATVNMKGGVGKTTLTVNLATCLAKNHGKRVLVVDLDTQISATLSLIAPQEFATIRKEKRTFNNLVYKAIKPKSKLSRNIDDAICRRVNGIEKLDLLPGDIELYDEFLVSEMLHERALDDDENDFSHAWNLFERNLIKGILEPVLDDYDFVILDCAPGYNLLTRSGLAASNFYLLPARPEPLSLVGIQLLERRIAKLRKTHQVEENNLHLQLLGIVFIMSGGTLLGRYYQQVIQRVYEDFPESKVFANRIPFDVNVSKAVDNFMPVVLSNSGSAGSKAFTKLTQEMLFKLDALNN